MAECDVCINDMQSTLHEMEQRFLIVSDPDGAEYRPLDAEDLEAKMTTKERELRSSMQQRVLLDQQVSNIMQSQRAKGLVELTRQAQSFMSNRDAERLVRDMQLQQDRMVEVAESLTEAQRIQQSTNDQVRQAITVAPEETNVAKPASRVADRRQQLLQRTMAAPQTATPSATSTSVDKKLKEVLFGSLLRFSSSHKSSQQQQQQQEREFDERVSLLSDHS
jgi:hypothetical protein